MHDMAGQLKFLHFDSFYERALKSMQDEFQQQASIDLDIFKLD